MPAASFRRLVTLTVGLTVVAGWVLMTIGVAAGFSVAALASLLTAIRLLAAFVVALPFAILGYLMAGWSLLAGYGLGASCKGGCPPDYARASQTLVDVHRAAYANFLVAVAIVVLALILAIIRRAAAARRRASSR